MPAPSSAPIDLEDVYAVLSNPVKRRIIEVIAERGATSFTDLKRSLNVSVGALYYSLDGLKEYVTRNSDRRYVLTEKGYLLYKAMRESENAIRGALVQRGRLGGLVEKHLLPYLIPKQLFIPLYRNNLLSGVTATLCMLTGLVTTLYTRLPLKILEVEQIPALLTVKVVGPFVLEPTLQLLLDYALSFALLASIVHAVARALSHTKPPTLSLVAGLALAQVPLYIYMIVQWFITGWSYPDVPVHTMIVLAIMLRVHQLLSIGMLTAAVSVFYELRDERGFLVAALLTYVSYAIKGFLP
ncbi:MAG: hypothetical protein ABWK01_02220 [Infirmifilum sp.]